MDRGADRLQSKGSQRAKHNWNNLACSHACFDSQLPALSPRTIAPFGDHQPYSGIWALSSAMCPPFVCHFQIRGRRSGSEHFPCFLSTLPSSHLPLPMFTHSWKKRLSKIMHISGYHTKQQQFWVEIFYILSTLCPFLLPFKICASKMPCVKSSRPSIRGHTAFFVSHQWKASLQVSRWICVISLSNRKRSPVHKEPKCLWKLLVKLLSGAFKFLLLTKITLQKPRFTGKRILKIRY